MASRYCPHRTATRYALTSSCSFRVEVVGGEINFTPLSERLLLASFESLKQLDILVILSLTFSETIIIVGFNPRIKKAFNLRWFVRRT